MRSKRSTTSKPKKYAEDSDDDQGNSVADDDSSVSHKVTASKNAKGKTFPASKTAKGKIAPVNKKAKKEATKDDDSIVETGRISFNRNQNGMLHTSPFGSSDWRTSFAKDY